MTNIFKLPRKDTPLIADIFVACNERGEYAVGTSKEDAIENLQHSTDEDYDLVNVTRFQAKLTPPGIVDGGRLNQ